MARYPSSRCPNCGALAHMCQCGTMQHPSQLPVRTQARMAGVSPRDFMTGDVPRQTFRTPQYQPPQAGGPVMAPQPRGSRFQPPQRVQPQMNIDQIMANPDVQQRINGIVENALANYNPEPPPAQETGIDPELVVQLAALTNEEVPSEPPVNNAGGRLNSYKKGREEVIAYVKEIAQLILGAGRQESGHDQNQHDRALGAGEPAAQVGPEGGDTGDGQVPDVLRESHPAGG